jgi:hypothetical protein
MDFDLALGVAVLEGTASRLPVLLTSIADIGLN